MNCHTREMAPVRPPGCPVTQVVMHSVLFTEFAQTFWSQDGVEEVPVFRILGYSPDEEASKTVFWGWD